MYARILLKCSTAIFGVIGGNCRPPNVCVSHVPHCCYKTTRQEAPWKEGGKGLFLLVVQGDSPLWQGRHGDKCVGSWSHGTHSQGAERDEAGARPILSLSFAPDPSPLAAADFIQKWVFPLQLNFSGCSQSTMYFHGSSKPSPVDNDNSPSPCLYVLVVKLCVYVKIQQKKFQLAS